MATSNDTLYGLAAHLQTMENNLTDFIFHCALRLSTMTDSRVFVLMENPNDGMTGRRFCGNRELVEEFFQRGLHPRQGHDVEIELNPESHPVRQKQVQTSFQPVLFPSHQTQPLQAQHPQQQQHQQQPLPLASAGSKRRSALDTNPDNSAKKSRSQDGAVSATGSSQDLSQKMECKTEIEEFLIDSDSEEGISMGTEANHTNASINGSSFVDSFDASLLNGTDGGSMISFSAGDNDQATPSRRIGLDAPNLTRKELAVAQITDPFKAFVRGSMENKLLASICYDAGKALTLSNPHPVESPLFREHCKQRINAYVDQFPNFLNVAVTPEATALFTRENESQIYTPESFMKMNARNGQKRGLKAMSKAGDGCR